MSFGATRGSGYSRQTGSPSPSVESRSSASNRSGHCVLGCFPLFLLDDRIYVILPRPDQRQGKLVAVVRRLLLKGLRCFPRRERTEAMSRGSFGDVEHRLVRMDDDVAQAMTRQCWLPRGTRPCTLPTPPP